MFLGRVNALDEVVVACLWELLFLEREDALGEGGLLSWHPLITAYLGGEDPDRLGAPLRVVLEGLVLSPDGGQGGLQPLLS